MLSIDCSIVCLLSMIGLMLLCCQLLLLPSSSKAKVSCGLPRLYLSLSAVCRWMDRGLIGGSDWCPSPGFSGTRRERGDIPGCAFDFARERAAIREVSRIRKNETSEESQAGRRTTRNETTKESPEALMEGEEPFLLLPVCCSSCFLLLPAAGCHQPVIDYSTTQVCICTVAS